MLQPHYQVSPGMRRRCFRGLMKICGEYGTLPNSYLIPETKIQKLGDSTISPGGPSDARPGVYEGDKFVAIKSIRHHEPQVAYKVKKVRYLTYSPYHDRADHPQNFCREVMTWKRLSHPNILELIGVTIDDNECTLVAPWLGNGNIIEFLRENLEANPLKLVRAMFHLYVYSLSSPAVRRRYTRSSVSPQHGPHPRCPERSTISTLVLERRLHWRREISLSLTTVTLALRISDSRGSLVIQALLPIKVSPSIQALPLPRLVDPRPLVPHFCGPRNGWTRKGPGPRGIVPQKTRTYIRWG